MFPLSEPIQITRVVSPRALAERTGLHLSTLWRMRQRRELPEPIRLSANRIGWPEEQVDEWLKTRSRVR